MADRTMQDPHFTKLTPKLELHAHLNGSLSEDCLRKLAELKADQNNSAVYNFSAFSDLKSCFDVFGIAHALTDSMDAVKLATKCCIEEFAADNVVYLELRSTPRATENMTKSDYISAVISAIKVSPIPTTLLISINRAYSVDEAVENVDIAIEYARLEPGIVVGVDLSGNPIDGKFSDFVKALNKVRENNLKITLHCGEVKSDAEVAEMIHFRPERLSHVTCLSNEAVEKIRQLKIPVELCVTSNLKCKTVRSVLEHQFRLYYPTGHPIILGTDDKGVFDTTLTSEYKLVQESFDLAEDFFRKMNKMAVEFSFAPEHIKKQLRLVF